MTSTLVPAPLDRVRTLRKRNASASWRRVSRFSPVSSPRAGREFELGLRAVACSDRTLAPENQPLIELEPAQLLLSALKPAEEGEGMVLRVLNPTGTAVEARGTLGVPFENAGAIRPDEQPAEVPVRREGRTIRFRVPSRALRTILIN